MFLSFVLIWHDKLYFVDCTLKFIARYRLVDHLKSHTQEKSCACPNCGIMFATYTKLKDHCRQSNKGKFCKLSC